MEALENNTLAPFVFKMERNVVRAFKTVSFNEFIAMEEKNTLNFRKHTSFPNQKYTSKHSPGAYYTVQGGSMFLIPTNLPEVNHLNLEHYVFNMGQYYESVKKVPEILVKESRDNHPLIDSGHQHIDLASVAENFMAVYFGDIRDNMQKEYQHNAIVSLSKKYDAKIFNRVINSFFSKRKNSQSLTKLTALLLILCASSEDYDFITDCTRNAFLYLHFKDFQSSLSHSTLEKILDCLRRSSKGSRTFGQDRYWILSERFVEHTFMRGDVKRMKMLLLHRCPSAFMAEFALEEYFIPDAELWPRKKAEGHESDNIHSYYSLKYYIYISCLLASLISVSPAKKSNITECIRLFWKSIPTPIIPLNDIQEFFLNLNLNFHWGPLWPTLQYFPKEFDTSVYQPRSLQHLSRFVAMQNYRSPSDIVSLDIPKQMHSYLHLGFDEFLD